MIPSVSFSWQFRILQQRSLSALVATWTREQSSLRCRRSAYRGGRRRAGGRNDLRSRSRDSISSISRDGWMLPAQRLAAITACLPSSSWPSTNGGDVRDDIQSETAESICTGWGRPSSAFDAALRPLEGEITVCPPYRQNPYMHLLEGFLALYEATGKARWRRKAEHIARPRDSRRGADAIANRGRRRAPPRRRTGRRTQARAAWASASSMNAWS